MNESYDLKSIFNAIETINTKKKKTSSLIKLNHTNQSTDNILPPTDILPITEKLILEAEKYSDKQKEKSLIQTPLTEDVLILNNEHKEQDITILNLEEIKLNVIDDLYSSLSKKVKKNTLKIIFELRQKIISLEEEIKIINLKKNDEVESGNVNNFEIDEEHLINEDSTLGENIIIDENNDDISETVIETLKLQDTLIQKSKRNEEKLLLKIIDLEQNVSLLTNKKKDINNKDNEVSIDEFKNNFNPHTEVLEKKNTKIESELIFFKENYERLVIENNEVKIKLSNSKERIISFEKNIKDLEKGFENLSSILSKNSVIKLNDPLLKTPSSIDSIRKDNIKSLTPEDSDIFNKKK
jgi:hypothetical protein